VFPPLPPGVVTRGGWKKDEEPSEAERRSVYVFVRRNTRYPMFEVSTCRIPTRAAPPELDGNRSAGARVA